MDSDGERRSQTETTLSIVSSCPQRRKFPFVVDEFSHNLSWGAAAMQAERVDRRLQFLSADNIEAAISIFGDYNVAPPYYIMIRDATKIQGGDVMSLVPPGAPPITVALLDMGHRSGEALTPTGLVLHSTADPGATAEQERAYFVRLQSPNRVNAHLVVDWSVALQLVPYTEVAWHAGPTANSRYLGMELCETKDPDQFHTSFLSWVAIAVQLFKTYRWPVDDAHLWSHARVSATFHETDHTDPIDYLASHGHTWDDVVARVKAGVGAETEAV